MVPMEVLLMVRVAGGPESVGKSAAMSLLDWYDLDQEVLLVMERPVPSVDLLNYVNDNDGPLEEDQAKVLKLGGACFCVSVWWSLKAAKLPLKMSSFRILSVSVGSFSLISHLQLFSFGPKF